MKKTLAITLSMFTLIAGTPVAADAPVDDPFMWMDSGTPAPQPQRPETKYQPITQPMPQQQIMAPTPQYQVPTGAVGHSNCYYPDGRPLTLDFPNGPMMQQHPGYTGQAYDTRRGYMAGDDGVLRGIQDNPCPEIYRRGGETPESAAGWLHPHDIRRVNTLEDRRIPIHSVGRYDPNSESLWYTDPAQPYSDAAKAWDVREGELLSQLMRRWAAESGWTVVYQSEADFILQTNVTIQGTFPEAAGQVIESFANASPPLRADLFTGNRVVVVRSSNEFDSR